MTAVKQTGRMCHRCRIEPAVAYEGEFIHTTSLCVECAEEADEREHELIMAAADAGWDHD